MIYIYHHLGLGDHIICNGLVRHCAEIDKVIIPCKWWNFPAVSKMYRDNSNIEVINVPSDNEATALFNGYQNTKIKTLKVTWNWDIGKETNTDFDEGFYRCCNLPFEYRWDKFYYDRDIDQEKEIYNKVNPPFDYVFVHDDSSRGLNIDNQKINTNLPIIKPIQGLVDNIFAYYHIMEMAKEIHCINSCFALFADSIFKSRENCYVHKYTRNDSLAHYKNFKVIE